MPKLSAQRYWRCETSTPPGQARRNSGTARHRCSPSALSRLFKGNSSNTTNTIGGVRSIVCTAAADSDGRNFCSTSGSRRNSCRNDERGGRKRRQELPNRCGFERAASATTIPTRALIRASQGDIEHSAPPEPRHHDGCRQERQHDAEKRRRRAPADHANRTLDPEQRERHSETNGEHCRDSGRSRRAPGGEELRTVRHDLEDRLSDGDRREPEQGRASFARHLVASPVTRDGASGRGDRSDDHHGRPLKDRWHPYNEHRHRMEKDG